MLVLYSFYLTSKLAPYICANNNKIESKPRPIINDKIYGFFFFDKIKPTKTHIGGTKYIENIKIKAMFSKKVYSKLRLALTAPSMPTKIALINIYNIG
jgi:hypothetical protein